LIRGAIERIRCGAEKTVDSDLVTRTSPNVLFRDLTNVIRLYGNDRIGKWSPSENGPTNTSILSPGTRSISSISTGDSINPPSVAITRNFLPPRESRKYRALEELIKRQRSVWPAQHNESDAQSADNDQAEILSDEQALHAH
jgi:hypothetical protein